MNHDEHPNDAALTRELRDSLSELAVPGRPPLAAITSRGRVRRRRRLAGFASLGGTCAAAVIALALGLAGVFGAAPTRGTLQSGTAFTLTSYANGTVSLKVSQVFDPAALQRALAQHGIPALVKIGTYCSSSPAAPSPIGDGVLLPPEGAGTPHRAAPGPVAQGIIESVNFPVKPSQLAPRVDPVTMVINPAAMPSRTELFIGYYNIGYTVFFDLIYTSAHTCSSAQAPPANP